MATVLKGKPVANGIESDVKKEVQELLGRNIEPMIAIVRVGEEIASVSYEKAAKIKMKKLGIRVKLFSYPETISEKDFVKEFIKIDQDEAIHGILVMQPLPQSISRETIAEIITPEKDIDGLSSTNLGHLVQQTSQANVPSTPAAVLALLEFYEIDIKGKDICVIGSSPVVGKPLALMLINRGATVSVCHIFTKDTKKYTQGADIVISATGVLGLVTEHHVKEGAVVVDVGFGYDTEGNPCGDVRYNEVIKKVEAITPVPGGVGAITTAILAKQVVQSARCFLKKLASE
ncbi:bifunctional 5,10-methylenetetrahydrofolate dehydrogenase/5,10-methenyltetrahydrofolate cyclohydrolase [Lacticigenium naphthae]|uniref:bifunctional 5,10-methylenetetrahydrofolate dehydrogenase/5,10-methenyltetrahydrofolate cyclohydrolase n=1 Tax=Lacticigenium naphthae TaxID=515351 RepID=UPI0004286454|nr:bifunctional 5,10-methylenetetrahydrofolate dehydrogenase/5,10-methenyltetrahydrofolate cyclohydrolase [Lacticigenium naphthae]